MIEAVETFVDCHYRQQIDTLVNYDSWAGFRDTLEDCRQDEAARRYEAKRSVVGGAGPILGVWLWAVAVGSAAGVAVARRPPLLRLVARYVWVLRIDVE